MMTDTTRAERSNRAVSHPDDFLGRMKSDYDYDLTCVVSE